MSTRWLARGLAGLAGAAGVASVLAYWLESPFLLRPSDGLVILAPWASVASAMAVGALLLRDDPGRAWRVTGEGGALLGPQVASQALGPMIVGVGTWFAVACGLPLWAFSWSGERRVESLQVLARADHGAFACRRPLVLAGGPLAHPESACVDDPAWARATPGHALEVEVRRGPLALELRAAGTQPGRKSNG